MLKKRSPLLALLVKERADTAACCVGRCSCLCQIELRIKRYGTRCNASDSTVLSDTCNIAL